ncbi:zinc finger CCCH domain-containing protein 34-like isoform X2 [Mangifera indica]|uniref:zinc finger CCCH domain-containing protein 34-like isoform X2 n=1 Tax=Mangifera indica TaxID=29780 RepID=UPI001CFA4AE4|nr:zinc finger CCCH domain-containing protein 34-like isoform X2 [Mangifera indica]
MEEEGQKWNTDCVYFLASPLTCKKGIDCEYRHCEIARLNPRDCWYWLAGNCINPACGFRHPPLDGHLTESRSESGPFPYQSSTPANKTTVPCYFYFNGFCNKGDRCSFMHGSEGNAPAGIYSRTTYAITDALPIGNKASSGIDTGSASTERCPNLVETATMPAMVMSIQAKDDLLQSAPRSIPMQSTSPQISLSEGEEAAAVKSDLRAPVEGFMETRSHVCTDWNSEEQVDGHIELEEPWESSPGFDVLVDSYKRSEKLSYEDDPEHLVNMNREHRALNSHFLGCDLEDQVEYTYPDAELLYDRQMYSDYDSLDNGHILGNVRKPSICARERMLDSLFSRKRKFLQQKVAVNDWSVDLRDYLRRRRVIDDHQIISSSRKHDSCRLVVQRQERARKHVIGQQLHKRLTAVVGKNYVESYGDYGTLSNGANQHVWLRHSKSRRFRQNSKEKRLAKQQSRSSEVSGKPFSRERRSTETSTAFTGPKTLAEIKEEKKKTEDQGDISGKTGNSSITLADFEGPKPLSEILKGKKKEAVSL